MLSNMVGIDTFLKGVSIYLKAHLYGNATTEDLWAGISKAAGIDVGKIMANWTLKVGFPVLTVEESSEGLKIRQNRFLSASIGLARLTAQALATSSQRRTRRSGTSLSRSRPSVRTAKPLSTTRLS